MFCKIDDFDKNNKYLAATSMEDIVGGLADWHEQIFCG